MFVMVTNLMSFNILMSSTKVKLGRFLMFREFEKDTKKKTLDGPFSYICVSRARKGRKWYLREPLDHFSQGVPFS